MFSKEEVVEVEVTYLVFKVVSLPPHCRGDWVMMCRMEAQHIRSSAVRNKKSVRVEVRKQSWDSK